MTRGKSRRSLAREKESAAMGRSTCFFREREGRGGVKMCPDIGMGTVLSAHGSHAKLMQERQGESKEEEARKEGH